MADTKISALTSATTPLAGTEELAIVQGGVTRKVAASALGIGEPLVTPRFTRQTSPPAAASSGESKLYFRDIARAALIACRTDVGDEVIMFPSLAHPFLTGAWVENATTVRVKSCSSVATGTVTSDYIANSINALNTATSSAAGSEAVWVSNALVLRDGSDFGDGYLMWGLSAFPDASYGTSTTGAVLRMGLYASGTMTLDGTRASGSSAVLEYNTVQSDSNWQLAVHNGTDVAVADTGLAFSGAKAWFYMIHSPRGGSSTYAYIANLTDGTSGSATIARNTGSTLLGRYSGVVTRGTVSRNHRFANQFVLIGGQI